MTYKEAADRIENHIEIHKLAEGQCAVHITEALRMAVALLRTADAKCSYTTNDSILSGNGLNSIYSSHKYVSGIREYP